MSYTELQLQSMSDYEVNKALALVLGEYEAPEEHAETHNFSDVESWHDYHGMLHHCHKNYCQDNDATMELAFERRIGLNFEFGEWLAETFRQSCCTQVSCYKDENPLRAISCVILMTGVGKSL